MEEIIRPFQTPPRSPGYRTPATAGVNRGAPSMTIGENRTGQTDFGPFARTDETEDWSRWPHMGHLTAGAQEIVSPWKDVANNFTINPNVCSIWRLRCHSESLTITFGDLDTLPRRISGTVFANAQRAATIEIILDWQTAATTPSRVLSLPGVRFTDGQAPAWSLTAARDVFHVQVTSDGEKYGVPIGFAMAEPT